MIEATPNLSNIDIQKAIDLLNNSTYSVVLNKIHNEYLYWDKAKYMVPNDVDPNVFWYAIKLKRNMNRIDISWGKIRLHFTITGKMQQMLHEFDLNFGGNIESNDIIPEKDHKVYLASSIMEEAIASSQMEGASTTRKVAKDMLRKQMKPVNKSQQMIANNYATIQYLVDHKNESFSKETLLNIHHLISTNTLERAADEGALRTDDNIMVMNSISGEVVHTPPPAAELNEHIGWLCRFANDNNSNELFIHPIIKGIIIHFMLAYLHPFVDGNGRTARSLIYWYLLKNGYWLTEYLSISRVIYHSKAKYEKAFLYTEMDGLDLTYFLIYNLSAMKTAYDDLKIYLQRKIKEQQSLVAFRGNSLINERQTQIIRLFSENPNAIFTAKSLTTRFSVNVKTIRGDLQQLVKCGLLCESPVNKRMIGYVRADNFDDKLKELMQ